MSWAHIKTQKGTPLSELEIIIEHLRLANIFPSIDAAKQYVPDLQCHGRRWRLAVDNWYVARGLPRPVSPQDHRSERFTGKQRQRESYHNPSLSPVQNHKPPEPEPKPKVEELTPHQLLMKEAMGRERRRAMP